MLRWRDSRDCITHQPPNFGAACWRRSYLGDAHSKRECDAAGFFRDARANYNDVVLWSKPSDWKNQTTTPNASVRYVYFNFNTREGPVVVEIPPAVEAGLVASWEPMLEGGHFYRLPARYSSAGVTEKPLAI